MKKMNPGMMAIMAKKKPMKMNDGGMPMVEKDGKKVPAFAADGKGKMAKGGMAHSDVAKDKPMMKKVAAKAVKGHEKRLHGMAKGGGVESKGKTKGKMIAMKKEETTFFIDNLDEIINRLKHINQLNKIQTFYND